MARCCGGEMTTTTKGEEGAEQESASGSDHLALLLRARAQADDSNEAEAFILFENPSWSYAAPFRRLTSCGAGNGVRTRDIQLGNVWPRYGTFRDASG
jgi:hypothetical protein